MKRLKILIFHTGSLGDTLVAVPALRAIRNYFTGARIAMLCDQQPEDHYVQARDLLEGSGLVDDFITYPAGSRCQEKFRDVNRLWETALHLGRTHYNGLVYLVRGGRSNYSLKRDLLLFRMIGIRRFFGHRGFPFVHSAQALRPLRAVPHQSDQILWRLAITGIPVPQPGHGQVDVGVSMEERRSVDLWAREKVPSGRRAWVGLGPGSKMPAKVWPVERFFEVVSMLIRKHDVWPVVFGGREDRALGLKLVERWGRGSVAAGELEVRQGIAALERCLLYLGNDTGTMHMAVAAGIPCVAVFSSRDYPGNWYPYGDGHVVFRTSIDCEGCMLQVCPRSNACLLAISSEDVFCATERIVLRRKPCAG
jgi:heptosyltransferase III